MNNKKIWMPHWPEPLWFEPPGNSLSRTKELLQRLDNPQDDLPPTVHVAGTNGKGSTIAFLRAMLEAAGYSVHSYTSPHMERFNEQINLGGNPIGEAELHTYLEHCRMAAGSDLQVKFFEGTTAAAMLAFSKNPVDILLLETGMGGSIDPTNAITHPILTIITTISMDHMDFLGNSLGAISQHKAGIMKTGTPCIASFQSDEAIMVLEKVAKDIGAPLYAYNKQWAVQKREEGMSYMDSNGEVVLPLPTLPGPHQILNAGNAIAAITLLEKFTVAGEDIENGLKNAHWPGRLERITSGEIAALLPDGWELWFDGGHNMAAGHAIAETVKQEWNDKPLYVIYGTTEGKDVTSMLQPLVEYTQKLYGVRVQAEPLSMTEDTIVAQAESAGYIHPIALPSIHDAISDILSDSANEPGHILILGSLFFRIELR